MILSPLALANVTLSLTAAAAATYLGLSGVVAQRFTTARSAAPSRPAPAAPLRFAARDGRAQIAATYLPAVGARAAVVFVHGKDGCRGEELKCPTFDLARRFNGAGIAVLMIDLRGHGQSSPARLTYGEHERHDVLGAVDWLRARGLLRIGVLGASMGGASSLLAAVEEPAIGALVIDSAFADFGRMIERQYRKLSKLPDFVLPGALAIARRLTGVQLERVRPLAAAAAIAGRPCLVIHSREDRFVLASDAVDIAAAAGAELWLTDTSGHIGSYRAAPERYAERVLGFFVRHLAP